MRCLGKQIPLLGDDESVGPDHSECMGFAPQRREDWYMTYHVRPLVVELAGARASIEPQDAQLLLIELGKLPPARHQAAEDTAAAIVRGLGAGYVVGLEDEHRRCLLRAVEGVRSRRSLPRGLEAFRRLLLRAPEPVV
jgi:hypothetical protein